LVEFGASIMVILLGGSGYIGSAFAAELNKRQIPHQIVSRCTTDYTDFESLCRLLEKTKPSFLINAAGSIGKPNVDACELARSEAVLGNVVLPQLISNACGISGVPWAQVSSGCIYSGAKILNDAKVRIEKDLTLPHVRKIVEDSPSSVLGYSEDDSPNFSFRESPCSFYSGTKALGEEVISKAKQTYIWRLRIPFDEHNDGRNYLTKLQRYDRVYDNVNSISHRQDFVRACLDLWGSGANFGTYNVTNPGFVTSRQVVEMIQNNLKVRRSFEFWKNDEEFYRLAASAPRSNCVLDTTKLLAAGVKMRPVVEALEESLLRWSSGAGAQI